MEQILVPGPAAQPPLFHGLARPSWSSLTLRLPRPFPQVRRPTRSGLRRLGACSRATRSFQVTRQGPSRPARSILRAMAAAAAAKEALMPPVFRSDPYPVYNFEVVVNGISDDGASVRGSFSEVSGLETEVSVIE